MINHDIKLKLGSQRNSLFIIEYHFVNLSAQKPQNMMMHDIKLKTGFTTQQPTHHHVTNKVHPNLDVSKKK